MAGFSKNELKSILKGAIEPAKRAILCKLDELIAAVEGSEVVSLDVNSTSVQDKGARDLDQFLYTVSEADARDYFYMDKRDPVFHVNMEDLAHMYGSDTKDPDAVFSALKKKGYLNG